MCHNFPESPSSELGIYPLGWRIPGHHAKMRINTGERSPGPGQGPGYMMGRVRAGGIRGISAGR